MLNVGLGEQVREGRGVMRIHRRHVPVEKRASDGLGIGRWRTVSGRESSMLGCSEHHRAQSSESKYVTPIPHGCALLRRQFYIAMLCLAMLCVKHMLGRRLGVALPVAHSLEAIRSPRP